MSFVAAAIGGSAVIGAGASIYGGLQQKDAAKKGMNAQIDMANRAIQTQQSGQSQALNYLDPFRQYGLNAGSTLQSLLYSPGQLQAQQQGELLRLQSDVDSLKKKQYASFEDWHRERGAQYTGGKGLKRSRGAYSAYTADINRQLTDAESKLNLYKQQSDLQTQQAAQGQPEIEASPWYQFQADLLNRSQDRAFAARGLTGSGFEAEERRRGLIELGAGETERQFGRLKGLYDIGANTAAVGAGTLTGTAANVANTQLAQGQAQAQGYTNIAGANTNIATGIANSVTGALGAGLNYYQFQNLIKANQPTTQPTKDPVFNSVDSGSYDYLRPRG